MKGSIGRAASDPAKLRAMLDQGDIVPLTMVLVQLTGDEAWLDRVAPFIRNASNHSERVPDDLKREIRERLAETLTALAKPGAAAPPRPSRALLHRMMNVTAGQTVGDEFVPMMLQQMVFETVDDPPPAPAPLPADAARNFHVVVIGAGMSGICAGVKLAEQGISYTIFEKNDEVGGTWLENVYPGCGVDTPSHFYAFSFAPNPGWSRYFCRQHELSAYFRTIADDYGLREHIRFRTEVTAARWDEDLRRWQVDVRGPDGHTETVTADAVITAVGQLNRAFIPDIKGLEDFGGPVFHTAQWDTSQDLTGKTVAMVGAGASGMQVGPAVSPIVKRLKVFQRSPHWIIANPTYHLEVGDAQHWLFENLPHYGQWHRFQLFWGFGDGVYPALQVDPDWPTPDISLNATSERYRQALIRHIKREIGEDRPDLLEKVIPKYPPYGKRVLLDNHWYRTLKRPNVELVSDPIDHVETGAIVTRGGERHEVDMIVMATGFQAGRMLWPIDFRGRDGVNLRDLWGEDDPRAYLGITVPGFPNLFMTYGPNTNVGHGGSAIFQAECQVGYIVSCLRAMIRNDWMAMECRQDVHDAFNEKVDAMHRGMVWAHRGVSNWYKNKHGRVITNMPFRIVDYWTMTQEPDFSAFEIETKATVERRVAETAA